MKKFLLFICLACSIAQAQTITEADLLGEWQVSNVVFDGNYYNVENDSLSISGDYAKKIKENSPNATDEDVKKEANWFVSSAQTFKVVIKPGYLFEAYKKSRLTDQGTYILPQNAALPIVFKGNTETIEFYSKDGKLTSTVIGRGSPSTIKVTFTKTR
ncbi:MAG: hypothetical protein V4581_14960 [Bacteroidota bacterium]